MTKLEDILRNIDTLTSIDLSCRFIGPQGATVLTAALKKYLSYLP